MLPLPLQSSDADTAIKKGRIESNTHPAATSSSAIKSITPHKSSLSTLTHVENTPSKISTTPSATPPSTYRAISPPPPIYQTTKPYLTVADLYMRYAPLSRPRRTMKVLPTISIQDLYKRFGKEKLVIPTPSKAHDSPSDCPKPRLKCSNSTVKTSSTTTKIE